MKAAAGTAHLFTGLAPAAGGKVRACCTCPARTLPTATAQTTAAPAARPSGGAEPNAELSELTGAVAVAHRVAVLAETDPAAPLVVALRAALEIADARRTARRDRRVAGLEVHGGDSAWWARWADQWMPYADLAALRAGPGATAFGIITTSPPAPSSTTGTVPTSRRTTRPATTAPAGPDRPTPC